MKINSLQDLYTSEVKDLRDCENRIAKTLPRIVEAGNAQEPRNAFARHLEQTMGEDAPAVVSDAGRIAWAQRVEHHGIAPYGMVRTFAIRLGFRDQARRLDQTIQEEGETDKRITNLAESHIIDEARTAR